MAENKYITAAYELYTDNEKGIHELMETATAEHPFQFISGMGMALDAFEEKLAALSMGDEFDFTLSVDEAYGPYMDEHVLDLDKEIFTIDGRFDDSRIYPGAVVPLVNSDGIRFHGLVVKVTAEKVTVDLNHQLAGHELHFKGRVITSRPATNAEIEEVAKMMSGEGGCGGCGGDCGGNCGEGCEGGCGGCK